MIPKTKIPKISNREIRAMVKLAVDQGWTFRAGNRGHHQVIPTNPKKEIVTVCSTPDGPRTIENTRADFRRSGLQGV